MKQILLIIFACILFYGCSKDDDKVDITVPESEVRNRDFGKFYRNGETAIYLINNSILNRNRGFDAVCPGIKWLQDRGYPHGDLGFMSVYKKSKDSDEYYIWCNCSLEFDINTGLSANPDIKVKFYNWSYNKTNKTYRIWEE
jgi:hypothetical protein